MTEKKTIGSFIAVLRKASGMTQRELAEMLNVSDKAVSRWERDECAPDLSLIPVIADIFHITTDELLRGERKHTTEETQNSQEEESAYVREKSARMYQNLLRTHLMRLKERSMIAIGIMFTGFITALICNFIFTKAVLGFFLALIFYAAALITEICFLRRAAVDEDDAYDYGKWLTYQNSVAAIGIQVFFALWLLIGITLPLLLVIGISGINAGLSFGAYLLCAPLFGFLFLFTGHIIDICLVKKKLSQKGLLFLTNEEKEHLKSQRKILKKTSLISGISALCLVLCAAFVSESTQVFIKPLRFDDYESFKEYMETDLSSSPEDWHYGYSPYDQSQAEVVILPNEEVETPDIHTIVDKQGNVLCEYENKRGDTIRWIKHSFSESPDGLPIYVITTRHYNKASGISSALAASLLILACADILIAAVIYIKKANGYPVSL